ncbi:MAG: SWIM zinc finger family protein [Actinomycetaceae bacterium]|nr:SWIM zinc finger family protein [Actinomycetaceae bacterium]
MNYVPSVLPVFEQVYGLASSGSIDRAEDYYDGIRLIRLEDRLAAFEVEGGRTYTLTLEWDGNGDLTGATCSCPHSASGYFCKHLVAALYSLSEDAQGLLDASNNWADPIRAAIAETTADSELISAYLQNLPTRDEVVHLVEKILAHNHSAQQYVLTLAKAHFSPPENLVAEIERGYKRTFRPRGYIDYYKVDDVAEEISLFLDFLADYVANGRAKEVEPILKRSIKRIQTIIGNADDSNGFLGEECQRAVDFYAETAKLAQLDPRNLARWIVKMRMESPSYPRFTLEQFLPALGETGLATYRQEVDKTLVKLPPGTEWYDNTDLHQMRLELAMYDDDPDEIVAVLSANPKYVAYWQIINVLLEAGRRREAMEWLERARTNERVTFRTLSDNPFWVPARHLARLYVEEGFPEEAHSYLWEKFCAIPNTETMETALVLKDFLVEQGQWEQQCTKFWETFEQRDWQGYNIPLLIALDTGDNQRAWKYADRWGAEYVWRQLAEKAGRLYPEKTLDLYLESLDKDLLTTGRKGAAGVVQKLHETKRFISTCDADVVPQLRATFETAVKNLREDYRIRPALMKALTQAGY